MKIKTDKYFIIRATRDLFRTSKMECFAKIVNGI